MTKQVAFDSITEGALLSKLEKEVVSHNQVIRYAGASGDFNPIHNDPEFAKKQGLDGTIGHGMLVMGIVGQMITAISDPGYVTNFNVKFVGMLKPGEAIEVSTSVKKKSEELGIKTAICSFQAQSPDKNVKAKGEFTLVCS